MVGLPNTRLIPAGWEAHHQPTAEAAMTAACVITRQATAPGTVGYDPQTGRSTYPAATVVYTGPCRLQRETRTQDNSRDVGGRQVTSRRYQLSIPLSADAVRVNDLVDITDATDTQSVGRRLRVTDVRAGSLLWDRTMTCEEWEPTTR